MRFWGSSSNKIRSFSPNLTFESSSLFLIQSSSKFLLLLFERTIPIMLLRSICSPMHANRSDSHLRFRISNSFFLICKIQHPPSFQSFFNYFINTLCFKATKKQKTSHKGMHPFLNIINLLSMGISEGL